MEQTSLVETLSEERKLAIVLNRDLLFGSRIRGALTTMGLEARFVPDTRQFADALAESGNAVSIGILDMNSAVDWHALKSALEDEIVPPTLAFGPHVDVASRRAAKAAGVTRIVSNGQFHADMTGLIDRYRRR